MSIPRNLSALAPNVSVAGVLNAAGGGTGTTTSTGSGALVLATSPTLVTPTLGTPVSGNFSTGTFTWPTFNQNTTGTAASITGIYSGTLTSSQITTGLGFTPYNATNPSGYTTNTGNVAGAASSTDNAIVRFDGTTGKIIQNSAAFVDDTGNFGLGVTPNAWSTQWKAIQIGARSFVAQGGVLDFIVGYNWYQDSTTTNKYIDTAGANAYIMDGAHKWFNAPSGTAGNAITFTQAMTLDASSNLAVVGTVTANSFSGAGTGLTGNAASLSIGGTAGGLSATLGFDKGGTGEITRQAALDALAGATTNGYYLRGNGTDVVMSAIQSVDITTALGFTPASVIRNTSITGTSTTTITPTSDTCDQYNVTALGVAANIAVPSGTAVNGQKLTLRIKDDNTARSLTWTTTAGGYRVIGTTLPSTTVATKTLYVGCIYNLTDGFWDVVSVAQQV